MIIFPPKQDNLTDKPVSGVWWKWFQDLTNQVNHISPVITGDQGNADVDLSALRPWPGNLTLLFTTALTAGRTVTLPVAPNGDKLHVARPATGAFNLNVGGIKNLAAGQWVTLQSDGSVWHTIAFGSL